METCLQLKCKTEEMEELKAPLKDACFIIQIPNRQKRKSWEVSQILIRHDQRALYTAAAKCSFISWHFWVREHFTPGLSAWEIRGEETGKRNVQRAGKHFCKSFGKFLHLHGAHLCGLVLAARFFSLLRKPSRHLSFLCFLIGPRCPHGNDVKQWVQSEPISRNFTPHSDSAARGPEAGTYGRAQQTKRKWIPWWKQNKKKKLSDGTAISPSHIRDEQGGVWNNSCCLDTNLGWSLAFGRMSDARVRQDRPKNQQLASVSHQRVYSYIISVPWRREEQAQLVRNIVCCLCRSKLQMQRGIKMFFYCKKVIVTLPKQACMNFGKANVREQSISLRVNWSWKRKLKSFVLILKGIWIQILKFWRDLLGLLRCQLQTAAWRVFFFSALECMILMCHLLAPFQTCITYYVLWSIVSGTAWRTTGMSWYCYESKWFDLQFTWKRFYKYCYRIFWQRCIFTILF